MANTGQFYKEAENYVNTVCQAFIAPHEDYIKIECKHKGSDGIAYIKLTDASDCAEYFDITALNTEGICKLVGRIIAGQETPERLTKYEQRKEIAKLFRS